MKKYSRIKINKKDKEIYFFYRVNLGGFIIGRYNLTTKELLGWNSYDKIGIFKLMNMPDINRYDYNIISSQHTGSKYLRDFIYLKYSNKINKAFVKAYEEYKK